MLDTLRRAFDTATDLFLAPTPRKIMKFFKRQKTQPEAVTSNPKAQPKLNENFYSQNPGDEPLDVYAVDIKRKTNRTTMHSPAQRREISNRASDRQIILLLVRVVLIFLLIVGGYVALRLVLDPLNEPSEKDLRQWEENSELMDKSRDASLFKQTSSELSQVAAGVDRALIEDRLERWDAAGRHLRSAESLSLSGIDEQAIVRVGQALAQSPENQKALRLLLDLYLRNGLYAEAVPVSIQLLDQNNQQWDVKLALLEALQNTGLFGASVALSQKMLSEQPSDVEVLELGAAAYRELNQPQKAFALYERVLEYQPKNLAALSGCGQINEQSGSPDLAIPYYMDLLDISPNIETYHALARCYAQQEEADKSVLFMGQAASLFGESAVSQWLREPEFDPVRESVYFRSFTDRIVGVETRQAIEAIRRREIEKEQPQVPGDQPEDLRPELNLKPGS